MSRYYPLDVAKIIHPSGSSVKSAKGRYAKFPIMQRETPQGSLTALG
jgi:hypothetical protein